MTQDLLVAVEDRVATLTMNRPDRRNAMSPAMLDSMLIHLDRFANDPAVGAVVLTGAGGAFCAGGDVKAMAEGTEFAETGLEGKVRALRRSMETARLLHEMPKPTLAAIPGAAAGAGLSLALACDLRIAVDTAKITTAFARVAYSGDFGGSWFLSKIVGTAKARELYYLAPVLTGAEAQEIGLVNRAVPQDAFADAVGGTARALANGPAVALGYMKRNMNAAEYQPLSACLDQEAMHHTRCGMTEDHKEAAAAFVAKRAPVFHGR